jgi:hypothetical protein
VATLFECFLRRVAACLDNFVVPAAALSLHQISFLLILACLSGGLELWTLFLVRDDSRVAAQHQSVQGAFI